MYDLKQATAGTKTLDNTTPVQLFAANSVRKWAYVSNPTAVGLWINLGATAAIGTGIYVPAGGGYQIDKDNLWRGTVSGISASGSGNVVGIMEMQ